MFDQERRTAEILQEAVEELNSMNFSQLLVPAVDNNIGMLELTNTLSNTTLSSIPKNYEGSPCIFFQLNKKQTSFATVFKTFLSRKLQSPNPS